MEKIEKEEQKYREIQELLENINNDGCHLEILEKAMEYWCSDYDKAEGFKFAIRLCLEDQYNNHRGENDVADYDKLITILKD